MNNEPQKTAPTESDSDFKYTPEQIAQMDAAQASFDRFAEARDESHDFNTKLVAKAVGASVLAGVGSLVAVGMNESAPKTDPTEVVDSTVHTVESYDVDAGVYPPITVEVAPPPVPTTEAGK